MGLEGVVGVVRGAAGDVFLHILACFGTEFDKSTTGLLSCVWIVACQKLVLRLKKNIAEHRAKDPKMQAQKVKNDLDC